MCSSVRDKYLPLKAFTYGELDSGEYLQLDACTKCQPVRRKSAIAAENFARGVITQEEFEAALTPIPYPAEDLQVYYNPNGGKYYHSEERCSSVKDRYLPLTGFDYAKLDTGSFADLKPCPYCDKILRKAEIDQLNIDMGISPETLATLDLTTPAANPVQTEEQPETVAVEEADPKDVEVSITIRN